MNPKSILYEQNRNYNKPLEEMTPQEVLSSSAGKIAKLFYQIAGSITKKDIENMDTEDKIQALQRLSTMYALMSKSMKKSSYSLFRTINLATAGKEEMESALLDMVKTTD